MWLEHAQGGTAGNGWMQHNLPWLAILAMLLQWFDGGSDAASAIDREDG